MLFLFRNARGISKTEIATCILKPIHYPHNENLHPTRLGRLGAEHELRMLRLEAAEEKLKSPNHLE
jgi:hypothetical protein